MNVNINVSTAATSKKLDIPKQTNKKEEFKKVLDNHELKSKNSSNENTDKKYDKNKNMDKVSNKKQSEDLKKKTAEASPTKDLSNSEDNNKLKAEIINFIELSIDELKENTEKPSKELDSADKSTEEVAQIQQILQSLSFMVQSDYKASATNNGKKELNPINLEQLMGEEQLTSETKSMLKNNLSEIVALLEKSKGNNEMSSQITEVLQKLTTVVEDLKGDLSLLKVPSFQTLNGNSEDKLIKDNLLKKVIELSTKTTSQALPKSQMQSSNDSEKESEFSGNSSSEEKFLNNLFGGDKDEMKISKAVNFMNQFETVKNLDTTKVFTPNAVIDKNNLEVDVIKTLKFMQINNIKDLTVKMNPKELGEITIKLTMESGIMKASISAQNKDTYNLLNHNIQDISDKLKNMDIKIQSLDINIYEDSTFFNKDSNEKNNNGRQNNNSKTNMILEEEEDIPISNNYFIEENQMNKFV